MCYENPNLIYIGGTTQSLSKRISGHRRDYKYRDNMKKKSHTRSFDILCFDDNYIELIKLCPCNSKEELNRIEGKYIRKYKRSKKLKCVNRNDPTGWDVDYEKKYQKEYHMANREKRLEMSKINYQKNIERERKRHMEWHKKHKKQQQEKHNCECGGKYTTANKAVHLKTKKHIKFIDESK